MNLKDYFQDHRGFGVLASADENGVVDAAVYSRPHVQEDGNVAFVMRDRLTHANIQTNPHASFLFREEGPGYRGIRLFLSRVGETDDPGKIKDYLRRQKPDPELVGEKRFLTTFKVEKVLNLIGAEEVNLDPLP
jgi:hypothetical protein